MASVCDVLIFRDIICIIIHHFRESAVPHRLSLCFLVVSAAVLISLHSGVVFIGFSRLYAGFLSSAKKSLLVDKESIDQG